MLSIEKFDLQIDSVLNILKLLLSNRTVKMSRKKTLLYDFRKIKGRVA